MTPSDIETLRALLLACLKDMAPRAADAIEFSMGRTKDVVGRDSLDETSEEEHYSTALEFHMRDRAHAELIEHALRRIDDGVIGECEECGADIPLKRLLHTPTATACIDCQRDLEETAARAIRNDEPNR